jgi:hypothetical protein
VRAARRHKIATGHPAPSDVVRTFSPGNGVDRPTTDAHRLCDLALRKPSLAQQLTDLVNYGRGDQSQTPSFKVDSPKAGNRRRAAGNLRSSSNPLLTVGVRQAPKVAIFGLGFCRFVV